MFSLCATVRGPPYGGQSNKRMPLNSKEKESLLDGTFALDCPMLELVPRNPSSTLSSYQGAGSIILNEAGHFEIKLYTRGEAPLEEVFAPLRWEIGKLIHGDNYYNLIAWDVRGRKWQAEGLLPNHNSGSNGTVISGKASQLTLREEKTGGHFLHLTFRSEVRFAPNRVVRTERRVDGNIRNWKGDLNLAQFVACGIEFEIEKVNGVTHLMAASKSVSFDEKTVDCIAQTFTFITGDMARWTLSEMGDGAEVETRVLATVPTDKRSRIGPPIRHDVQHQDVWVLFERYLSYGLKSAETFHPLGPLVRGILASGLAAIEVQALVLSVSVESLLNNHFSKVMPEDPVTATNIQAVEKLVNEAGCLDDGFRKRLTGTLANMKRPRAKDFLFHLRDQNLLDADLVKSYGELRNKSAHGGDVNWGDFQSHLDQCSAVLVLFYQLVFLRIGYTGQYTNYADYGYPPRSFIAALPDQTNNGTQDSADV